MKDILYTHRVVVVATWILAASGGLFVTGCAKAGKSPRLQLRSSQTRQVYAQQFRDAYYARLDTGEFEIVLVDDGTGGGATKAHSAEAGQPLRPSQAAPLRQVVHIRVHWRPLRGSKPDHPSATNAVVDWYVTAPTGDAPQADDRLHYQGAAFVEIGTKNGVAKVHVSKGQVALVEAVGSLHDPVGRSVLTGSFTARRNEAMVAANTAPLRLDAAAARAIRPARSVQPSRENIPGGGGQ